MKTDTLIHILKSVSMESNYSQELFISFNTVSGWTGYTHVWLSPYLYKFSEHRFEYSWEKNTFKELYLISEDSCFLEWNRIQFVSSDVNLSTVIDLRSDVCGESHVSHYSGHKYVCWMDYVDNIIIKNDDLTKNRKTASDVIIEKYKPIKDDPEPIPTLSVWYRIKKLFKK